MIAINELHRVCSYLQRLHIVCIVKTRLIREIVKVIIWVGETNDYCYIWVGRSERLISEASRLPKKHDFTSWICKKIDFQENSLEKMIMKCNILRKRNFGLRDFGGEIFQFWCNFCAVSSFIQHSNLFKSVKCCPKTWNSKKKVSFIGSNIY